MGRRDKPGDDGGEASGDGLTHKPVVIRKRMIGPFQSAVW